MKRAYWFHAVLLIGLGGSLGLACGGVGDLTVLGASTGGASGASSSGTGTSSSSGGTTDVPCDVAAAFSVCISCHSNPPIAGAMGSLDNYADLTAPAPADPLSPPQPGNTMVQQALIRMMDTTRPMPPAGIPGPTSAQIQAVQAWVTAGSPPGSCGSADAGPPDMTFTGPSVCASGSYATFTGDGDPSMTPGEKCVSCHANSGGEAPPLTIGGTVFPTGHVPNDCVPTSAQSQDLQLAKVVITDANNTTLTLNVDWAGNFMTEQPVAFPIHAKVVYKGKERPMLTAQTSGDCNACHTDSGTKNAPGRIALPQ